LDNDVREGLFLAEKQGIGIYKPYKSSCGRFSVDPEKEYAEFEDYLAKIKESYIVTPKLKL